MPARMSSGAAAFARSIAAASSREARGDRGEYALAGARAAPELDLEAALRERHLDAADGREDLELGQCPEVPDAEDPSFELPQAHAEREVEALARPADDGVGVEALRHHDRRERVRVRALVVA